MNDFFLVQAQPYPINLEYKYLVNMAIVGEDTLLDNSIYENCKITVKEHPSRILSQPMLFNSIFLNCQIKISYVQLLVCDIEFCLFEECVFIVVGNFSKYSYDASDLKEMIIKNGKNYINSAKFFFEEK